MLSVKKSNFLGTKKLTNRYQSILEDLRDTPYCQGALLTEVEEMISHDVKGQLQILGDNYKSYLLKKINPFLKNKIFQ
jgi:hypothetical protein